MTVQEIARVFEACLRRSALGVCLVVTAAGIAARDTRGGRPRHPRVSQLAKVPHWTRTRSGRPRTWKPCEAAGKRKRRAGSLCVSARGLSGVF